MTELIWEGKYDKDGRKVAPLRVALPFQTVETVNESAADRQRTLSMFAQGRDTEWRNKLIWGDKKYVLPSLLPEFAGKVNLIYIDPPFNVGADFCFTTTIPDSDESFTKEPSIIEQKAYRDTWGRGMDSYLQWFYETVVLLHELLAEDGSLYVHLDWHVGHYAKCVLDEVFGVDRFRNEIVREKTNPKNYTRNGFGNIHDMIFFYSKGDLFKWSKPYAERDTAKVRADFPFVDTSGRRYKTAPLHAPGIRYGESGQPWRALTPPPGNHWRYVQSTLEKLDKDGNIEWSSTGNPREKIYADESSGVFLQDIWLGVKDQKEEYPSAKNPELLERIIKASSEEGDLVLDCFCGSGTTAAVAEKLKRRWITCDLGRFAIHTTRKRLLGIPDLRPFVVQNLGKYERQVWQAELVKSADGQSPTSNLQSLQRAYIDFILQLYGAQPMNGYNWLHGVRAGRVVHVGSVDAPVSLGDVTNIAVEFRKAVGSGKDAPTSNSIDVLGWDFAFERNEVARQQAAVANIQMRFLRIPRDVMDKRAVDAGEIRFFELAALSVEPQVKGRDVVLKLSNFVIPPDDVPEEIRKAIKHWEQWIDYWAVDWDNRSDTFHNEWQSYRTRKEKTLQKQVTNKYDQPGEYRIVVKVVDILGNDTTKTLVVKV
jgi:DNA modification methylase